MTNNKLIFKKNINNQGIPITNCFFDDDPENILATMVEDVPENLMLARVVLIYKKGDTNDCANYRLIFLLNTMYT